MPVLHMKSDSKTWLQLYVDAMTERDPYKRLALVRELRRMPKQDDSAEFLDTIIEDRTIRRPDARPRKTKIARPRKSR